MVFSPFLSFKFWIISHIQFGLGHSGSQILAHSDISNDCLVMSYSYVYLQNYFVGTHKSNSLLNNHY